MRILVVNIVCVLNMFLIILIKDFASSTGECYRNLSHYLGSWDKGPKHLKMEGCFSRVVRKWKTPLHELPSLGSMGDIRTATTLIIDGKQRGAAVI